MCFLLDSSCYFFDICHLLEMPISSWWIRIRCTWKLLWLVVLVNWTATDTSPKKSDICVIQVFLEITFSRKHFVYFEVQKMPVPLLASVEITFNICMDYLIFQTYMVAKRHSTRRSESGVNWLLCKSNTSFRCWTSELLSINSLKMIPWCRNV